MFRTIGFQENIILRFHGFTEADFVGFILGKKKGTNIQFLHIQGNNVAREFQKIIIGHFFKILKVFFHRFI